MQRPQLDGMPEQGGMSTAGEPSVEPAAKTDRRFSTSSEPQLGHSTSPSQSEESTKVSKSLEHFSQLNSYIGMMEYDASQKAKVKTGHRFGIALGVIAFHFS